MQQIQSNEKVNHLQGCDYFIYVFIHLVDWSDSTDAFMRIFYPTAVIEISMKHNKNFVISFYLLLNHLFFFQCDCSLCNGYNVWLKNANLSNVSFLSLALDIYICIYVRYLRPKKSHNYMNILNNLIVSNTTILHSTNDQLIFLANANAIFFLKTNLHKSILNGNKNHFV